MNPKIPSLTHAAFAIGLALLFLNAGMDKFKNPNPGRVSQKLIQSNLVEEQNFNAPVGYWVMMNSMKKSGFLKVIGVLQILSAGLIFIPRTRLVGLLLLMPVTVNIFLLHLFLDNRPFENVQTGIFLGINLMLVLYYIDRLKYFLMKSSEIGKMKLSSS
ncbi:MAG: hypothetical protein MK086_08050 [Flavobacteriales bacterium]|nr:hypothetical protein [Flavobacteriales bacterium]